MPMTDSGSHLTVDAAGQSGTADAQVLAAAIGPAVPFGEWPSPIAAADVAGARAKGSFPTVLGANTWWQVELPGEDGRTTVMHSSGGKQTTLLPAPWNARTRVHEYGGLSYLPIPRSALRSGPAGPATQEPGRRKGGSERGHLLLFANFADQRLYLAAPGVAEGKESPTPITPDPTAITAPSGSGTLVVAGLRYADFALSPDGQELWCVQERHEDGKVSRAIVAVPLDGSAADKPDAIRTLVDGSDFFAYPTPSPDGNWLAWICWNHPHMPWDGTELRVAPVKNGMPGRGRLLKGSQRESVLAPLWRDNANLYVATDWTGWWNIYQLGLGGEPPMALFPADEDFAGPIWELGARPFALLSDGRLAVTHGAGASRLAILDPESFELKDVDTPFDEFGYALSADGDSITAVAGGPMRRSAVIRVDAATGKTEVLQPDAGRSGAGALPASAPARRFRRTLGPGGTRVSVSADESRRHRAVRPAAAVRHLGARRADEPSLAGPRPDQGLLHQPGHRDHRRELWRL